MTWRRFILSNHETVKRFNQSRLRRRGSCSDQNLILRHRERNHATILSKWRLSSQTVFNIWSSPTRAAQFAASVYASLRSAKPLAAVDILLRLAAGKPAFVLTGEQPGTGLMARNTLGNPALLLRQPASRKRQQA